MAKLTDPTIFFPRQDRLPKILVGVLLLLLVFLQWRLWMGEGGIAELWQLRAEIEKQAQQNEQLAQHNRRLAAEVDDLKSGLGAIEARARYQLGMIRQGEVFYMITSP